MAFLYFSRLKILTADNFFHLFCQKGYPAADREPRDENTKMRTRVAARAAMFSSFSDDLRRLIGSETTRSGLLNLFEMLQVTF